MYKGTSSVRVDATDDGLAAAVGRCDVFRLGASLFCCWRWCTGDADDDDDDDDDATSSGDAVEMPCFRVRFSGAPTSGLDWRRPRQVRAGSALDNSSRTVPPASPSWSRSPSTASTRRANTATLNQASAVFLRNTLELHNQCRLFSRNASVLNRSYFANFAQNRLPWQRPLRNRKKNSWSRKLTQIPVIWWKDRKIGSVDPEIIWLK